MICGDDGSGFRVHGSGLEYRGHFAFNNPELLNLAVASIINKLRGWAVSMSIVGLLITGVLSLFPRARKHEKKLIIDGVLIASFLLAVALTAQAIIRFLLAQL